MRDNKLGTIEDRAAELRRMIVDRINENDGGTFYLNGLPAEHQTGYYVSLSQWEMPVGSPITEADLVEFLLEARDVLREGYLLGAWKYEGQTYLDVTTHVLDVNTAMEIARRESQQAIWDCAAKTELKGPW